MQEIEATASAGHGVGNDLAHGVGVIRAEIVSRNVHLAQSRLPAETVSRLVPGDARSAQIARDESRSFRNQVSGHGQLTPDLVRVPLLEQLDEVRMADGMRRHLMSAADKLADVIPCQILLLLADPVRNDVERAAPRSQRNRSTGPSFPSKTGCSAPAP